MSGLMVAILYFQFRVCVYPSHSTSEENKSVPMYEWSYGHQLVFSVPGLCPFFQPFNQPDENGKAMCMRPDIMEEGELVEFPQYKK